MTGKLSVFASTVEKFKVLCTFFSIPVPAFEEKDLAIDFVSDRIIYIASRPGAYSDVFPETHAMKLFIRYCMYISSNTGMEAKIVEIFYAPMIREFRDTKNCRVCGKLLTFRNSSDDGCICMPCWRVENAHRCLRCGEEMTEQNRSVDDPEMCDYCSHMHAKTMAE